MTEEKLKFVDDKLFVYIPLSQYDGGESEIYKAQLVMTKEIFQECYKKWIKQKPKEIGHCKDCKYFEYDSVAKVDGIPLIVAHEICSKWGDGCKTDENGYCFLFEPKMSEIPTSSKPEISSFYGLKSYVRERSEE